jgi:two-component system cell cycle response regulator DivK
MASISILLVDDHQDSRVVYSTILRHHGYTVLEAADGDEALRLTHGAVPGVVVTDLNMPGLDGASLIRVLKRDPDLAAIPTLVVTADTSWEARCEAESAGCSAFVLKPLSPRALVAAVQALRPADAAAVHPV